MHKYWAICRASILTTLTYRVPLLVWNIGEIISLLTIIAVWLSVSAGKTIGGYTRSELILYYIFILFLQRIVNWHPFYDVKEEIRDGTLSFWLAKPISNYRRRVFQELGWHIVSSTSGLITTLVIVLLLGVGLSFNLTVLKIIFLASVIVLSCLICFTISMCLAQLCFWLMEVDGINSLFFTLIFIFGGQGIPVSFFPPGIHWLVEILPFRYLFSFPLEIYFGKISVLEIFRGYMIEVIWLLILISIYRRMWRAGLKRFAAFGN